MTGFAVASWYPDAWFDPTAAATHVYLLLSCFSVAVSAALGWLPFRRPPAAPRLAP